MADAGDDEEDSEGASYAGLSHWVNVLVVGALE